MKLSKIGRIAVRYWQQIPKDFEHVRLDQWIIMPNHMHGIVVIDNPNRSHVPRHVATGIQPLPKGSLSSIINHYKGNVTKYCKNYGFESFSWQPRFYDRVIRDEDELNRIREYIKYNPIKWELQKAPK